MPRAVSNVRKRKAGAGFGRLGAVVLCCAGLSAYFTYHAVNGRHGLMARARLVERSVVLDREIAALEAVRISLRRDIALLGSDPPHPDMVEEIAITVLGYVRPGERLLRTRPLPDAVPAASR